jgi:23S rRNA pseudouridine2605 synthase
MEERLQKIMAQAGLGSRRDCEEYIVAGRVRVNGAVAVIGQKANPAVDNISVDGRTIKPAEQKIYIALHKPRYVLSTVDAEPGDSRQTVRSLVEVSERLYPVGRLDFESEGLVLMTNDGELAQRLTHPSHGHSKEYRVLLARQPDVEQIATWQRGVVLEDGYKTQRAEVRIESLAGKGAWVRIIMREGRKRQIREIGAILALPVVRIIRVRIGNLLLGNLKPGEWRYLTSTEIVALKEDRPGLPAFPDMTRKSPANVRSRQPRKPSSRGDRAPAPITGRKSPGRTAPPNETSKAPTRRSPRSETSRAPERSERKPVPAGSNTAPDRNSDHRSSPGGSGNTPERSENRRSSNGAGRAPARRPAPGGAGKAPQRRSPSGEAGRAPARSERRPSPAGISKAPVRRDRPVSTRKPSSRKPK